MARKTARFTALLTAEDDAKLKALCNLDNESKGAVLRQAIRAQYAMRVAGRPTCATGKECYVPGMHLPVTHPGLVPAPPPPAGSQAVAG